MDNNNLFSIGEIAKAIGITRKIILNYETKGLITPDKKDGTTGNRYYTIDTFTQIRTIRVFQELKSRFPKSNKIKAPPHFYTSCRRPFADDGLGKLLFQIRKLLPDKKRI